MIILGQQKKILISLPETLLHEVDKLADLQNVNRSECIREAMKMYIGEKRKAKIQALMKKGYMEMSEINLEWAEKCFEADCDLQQSYEEKLAECE